MPAKCITILMRPRQLSVVLFDFTFAYMNLSFTNTNNNNNKLSTKLQNSLSFYLSIYLSVPCNIYNPFKCDSIGSIVSSIKSVLSFQQNSLLTIYPEMHATRNYITQAGYIRISPLVFLIFFLLI